MGIPRLTQDIRPHASPIILSGRSDGTDGDRVGKVVVDGPSLVYHVHSLLLKHHRSKLSANTSDQRRKDVLLSYSSINCAVVDFLELLLQSGVIIVRILFDGALPLSKHSTRLERLEKARQQLEHYQLLNSRVPLIDAQCLVSLQNVLSNDLWTVCPGITPSSILPIPPFIVPAVIEHLMNDAQWSKVTEIVNGESDAYCTSLAANEEAAVLSNDSDMIVHDLGDKGCLINLSSIELIHDQGKSRLLEAMSLLPRVVASGLGVVDLQLYAYLRSIDGQATSPSIAQRTRVFDTSEVSARSSFSKFLEAYRDPTLSMAGSTQIASQLSHLDPRTAELVCGLHAGMEPRVYLPVLFEDPSRDSSWTYGKELRQVAYSILIDWFTDNVTAIERNHVVEFSRRGRSINDNLASILSQKQTTKRVSSLLRNLQIDPKSVSSESHLLLKLYSFAARTVQLIKSRDAKSCMVQICRLMSMNTKGSFSPTWDDLHVLANMQAVLYSLRMIKQICSYVNKKASSKPQLGMQEQRLVQILDTMPTISSLFLDAIQLQRTFCELPQSLRMDEYRIIESVTKSDIELIQHEETNGSTTLIAITRSPQQSTGEQKRSTGKSLRGVSKQVSRKTQQKSTNCTSNNPFAVLDDR